MKKSAMVMVFGVFDRLHPGHRELLSQAKKHGTKLIAVVARDSSVLKLKKKKPQQSERRRMEGVRKIRGVTKVVLGDKKQSSYLIVKRYKPDVICLGYDQKRLADDLQKYMRLGYLPKIKSIVLKPHKPQKFHTSLQTPASFT